MGGVGSGSRKGYVPTEEHKQKLRENARKRRTRKLDFESIEVREQVKHTLARVIREHGVPAVVEIIKRGPWQLVETEGRTGPDVMELHQEQSRLWQYAMNFASDRGGLPRVTELDMQNAEGIPPLKVSIVGFAKPDDV